MGSLKKGSTQLRGLPGWIRVTNSCRLRVWHPDSNQSLPNHSSGARRAVQKKALPNHLNEKTKISDTPSCLFKMTMFLLGLK